jgi:hypothetical protein
MDEGIVYDVEERGPYVMRNGRRVSLARDRRGEAHGQGIDARPRPRSKMTDAEVEAEMERVRQWFRKRREENPEQTEVFLKHGEFIYRNCSCSACECARVLEAETEEFKEQVKKRAVVEKDEESPAYTYEVAHRQKQNRGQRQGQGQEQSEEYVWVPHKRARTQGSERPQTATGEGGAEEEWADLVAGKSLAR